VIHNDDTSMRVLKLVRSNDDGRSGVFTSGIVSISGGRKIALYFTGWKHAGENLADVLRRRAAELDAPIQMCDALSRNTPKLAGVQVLLANCLAHGRRQVVDVAANFPEECRYVLESLGAVYSFDAEAKERGLTPEERLTTAAYNTWATANNQPLQSTTAGAAIYNGIVNMVNAQKIGGTTGALPANFYSVPLPANFYGTAANSYDITTLQGYKSYQLRNAYNTGFGALYQSGSSRYIQFGVKLYF
jgi:hypothetical protein